MVRIVVVLHHSALFDSNERESVLLVHFSVQCFLKRYTADHSSMFMFIRFKAAVGIDNIVLILFLLISLHMWMNEQNNATHIHWIGASREIFTSKGSLEIFVMWECLLIFLKRKIWAHSNSLMISHYFEINETFKANIFFYMYEKYFTKKSI